MFGSSVISWGCSLLKKRGELGYGSHGFMPDPDRARANCTSAAQGVEARTVKYCRGDVHLCASRQGLVKLH